MLVPSECLDLLAENLEACAYQKSVETIINFYVKDSLFASV